MNKKNLMTVIVVVLLTAGGLLLVSRLGAEPDPYSVESLTQTVTIRDRETGLEWEVRRGKMERDLLMRPSPIQLDEGLPNPETGTLTGFPVDEQDWIETVERLNKAAAEIKSPW